MTATSAGLLLFRRERGALQVLLAHPGGPFWRNHDDGAWTIPKGEGADGEPAEATALREFGEEIGPAPPGVPLPLGGIRQRGGKWVEAFALEGDFDVAALHSNRFELEWPPGSGKRRSFPEIDRAAWFTLDEARKKIRDTQAELLDRLLARIDRAARDDAG
jgi:predicted NUDIX family NTP pyrophosphohydrolase